MKALNFITKKPSTQVLVSLNFIYAIVYLAVVNLVAVWLIAHPQYQDDIMIDKVLVFVGVLIAYVFMSIASVGTVPALFMVASGILSVFMLLSIPLTIIIHLLHQAGSVMVSDFAIIINRYGLTTSLLWCVPATIIGWLNLRATSYIFKSL